MKKAIVEYKDVQHTIEVSDVIATLSDACNIIAERIDLGDIDDEMLKILHEGISKIDEYYVQKAQEVFKVKDLFVIEFRIPDEDSKYSDFCLLSDRDYILNQFPPELYRWN